MLRKILVATTATFFTSCKTLPTDPFPNQMSLGYLGIEFNHWSGRTIGALDINLTDSNFANENFQFVGLWQGTLIIKSPACGIEKTMRFNQITIIKISDLILKPMKCTIDLYAYTDQVKSGSPSQSNSGRSVGSQHNITEHGQIHLNTEKNPINMIVNNKMFIGQASFQRSEGSLTLNTTFQIQTPSKKGEFRIKGCQYNALEGTYENNTFTVAVKDIYGKSNLVPADSCDFEINVLPWDDFPNSFVGNLSINVYSGAVVKLEQPSISLTREEDDDGNISNVFVVRGASYVIGIAVDKEFEIENELNLSNYDPRKVYFVRTVTRNGRKSVMAVQNMKYLWVSE